MSSSLPASLRKKEIPSSDGELPPSLRPKKEEKYNPFLEEDSLDKDIERGQAMATSRIIERIAGTPGNIASFLPESTRILPILGNLKKLPTESQLKDWSEKGTLGYTKPKNEFEERVGEFTGDVASQMLGGPVKGVFTTTARLVGVPLAGQISQEIAKFSGAGVKGQQAIKWGTMILLDLLSGVKAAGGGARKYGNTLLEEAEKAIPKGAQAEVPDLIKSLQKVKNELEEGLTGPHTTDALGAIKEILGKAKNGKLSADLFPKLRKDINTLIENMKGFQIGGSPRRIKKMAVGNLNRVKQKVIEAGEKWGEKNSPEFAKLWKEGNEALSVYHKSNDISRFISKKAKITNPTLRTMLGVHGALHPAMTAKVLGAKKAVEMGTRFPTAMVYRVLKSPVLRRHYANILKYASRGKASEMSSAIKRMEKEMEKEKIQ